MTTLWYSFRPPLLLLATVTFGGHTCYLSGFLGDGQIDVVIRCPSITSVPIKQAFPLDVEKHEVEAIVEVLLESLCNMQEAA